ncbi:glycosyltransferase family 2 protein [Bariatricus sp. SGI.154]|uniref:glycosyltransferase family 2 protein n=1 Tax=Bariatricus sp. SGI.154 TaxID=3420549 RepID=UPI003D010935
MTEISIIVPVYKTEKYLEKCIESILSQTFTDFELILVDDGSPDRCGEICDKYAQKDKRIKVIHQKNQGVSSARNVGLENARGQYISFIDSDDYLLPDMYEKMMPYFSEKIDVVMCGFYVEKENLGKLEKQLSTSEYFSTEELLSELFGMPNRVAGPCWNKIIRRTVIGNKRFIEERKQAEDWLFLIDCFQNCKGGVKLSDPLYVFCERSGSASRTEDIDTIYERLAESNPASIKIAKRYSKELEGKAIDKYLDDCLLYLPELKKRGNKLQIRYEKKVGYIKCGMIRQMIRAFFTNLLSKKKILSYFLEMIKL